MQTQMTFEICHALTQLTRQLLGAGERKTQTHVLAKGQLYRVVVSLEPVPTDQLHDVINRHMQGDPHGNTHPIPAGPAQ